MLSGYAFDFKGHGVFTPDGRADNITDVEAHNSALEAAELAEWSTKPDRFAAYVAKGTVTTWRGEVLGAIVSRNVYRNNLGARIESVRVRGNNGATYSGRYGCDWSQLVRLRKVKGA